MVAKVNWEIWRKQYVQGPDDLDYKRLSEYKGAPAYSSLRNRASKEDWPSQRRHYRANLGTLAGTVPEAQQVAQRVDQIIDAAEMLTRHTKLFRLAGKIGLTKLRNVNPDALSVKEALDLLKWAVDGERLTEGLATQRQELDVKSLPDAELERLANGG
jgi:hypothetical protein